jgi:hypothetical protein
LCNFKHLLYCIALSLVEFLGVKGNASLGCEQLADRANEKHTILFVFNVVGDVGLGIIAESEPVEDVCDKFKVGLAEVLHRDIPVVPEGTHDLAEVAKLTI